MFGHVFLRYMKTVFPCLRIIMLHVFAMCDNFFYYTKVIKIYFSTYVTWKRREYKHQRHQLKIIITVRVIMIKIVRLLHKNNK